MTVFGQASVIWHEFVPIQPVHSLCRARLVVTVSDHSCVRLASFVNYGEGGSENVTFWLQPRSGLFSLRPQHRFQGLQLRSFPREGT